MDFHFETEVRVRFAETDAQGIAHNAVYLVWFEVARIDYLARFRGGYPGLRADGIEALTIEAARPLPRARALRRPAHDPRPLRRPARRALPLRLLGRARGRRRAVADGWTRHACVDATTLPADARAGLARRRDQRCGAADAGRPVGPVGPLGPVGPGFFLGGSTGLGFVPTWTMRVSPR